MSERFEMRVSEELLAKIDGLRGREPRASFVKWVLEEYVAGMSRPRVRLPSVAEVAEVKRAAEDPVPGSEGKPASGLGVEYRRVLEEAKAATFAGKPQRGEFGSGAEWQEAMRAWKEQR